MLPPTPLLPVRAYGISQGARVVIKTFRHDLNKDVEHSISLDHAGRIERLNT
jgi:hypothetical protein